mmetsp:Transcript_9538/g.27007  ORF Transcript_9538/g.27007 Transcript_9538/m.27007 type:complete len:209 (+) Transcript_9538:181-807(+)
MSGWPGWTEGGEPERAGDLAPLVVRVGVLLVPRAQLGDGHQPLDVGRNDREGCEAVGRHELEAVEHERAQLGQQPKVRDGRLVVRAEEPTGLLDQPRVGGHELGQALGQEPRPELLEGRLAVRGLGEALRVAVPAARHERKVARRAPRAVKVLCVIYRLLDPQPRVLVLRKSLARPVAPGPHQNGQALRQHVAVHLQDRQLPEREGGL